MTLRNFSRIAGLLAGTALAFSSQAALAQQDDDVSGGPGAVPEIASEDVVDWPQASDVEFVSEPVVQDVSAYPDDYPPYLEDPAFEEASLQSEPSPVYVADPAAVAPVRGYSDEEREAWLDACRSRYSDNGLGGALIGGLLGGFAGNRIAGEGNRTVGAIAGAVVGAAAGAAIDKAEDRGRDECEIYLERYEASGGQYNPYGAYYGYGQVAYGGLYPCQQANCEGHDGSHYHGCGHLLVYVPVVMHVPGIVREPRQEADGIDEY